MLRQKLYSAGLLIYCSLITIGGFQEKAGSERMTVNGKNSMTSQKSRPKLPSLDLNQSALQFARDYVKRNTWGLKQLKKRSQPEFRIINSVFSKHDIPRELKYMAIVESNLNTDTVCNSTGATGLWQLMPVTASELGLKITDEVDERLHAYKSSVAAAKYLKQLYAEFGDWLLVVAAYNSGPAKVSRAMNLSGLSNFWQLQNFLPTETRNHVKRFVGMLYFFEGKNKATDLVMGRL